MAKIAFLQSSTFVPCCFHVPTSSQPLLIPGANRILVVAVMSCVYCANAIGADNTFEPYLGYTFGSDDNVLGLASDSQYLRLTGQADGSDTTSTARGGIRAVYQLSRQSFDLNAELSKTRYAHFQSLDYDGRNVQANWHWMIGNALSGTIGTTNVQSVGQLSNFQQLTRNLRTDGQAYGNAEWMVTPSWRVVLKGSKYALRYDLAAQQYANIDESRIESGLSYVSASGNNIGLLLQQTDGKYPNRTRFTGQNEDFQQNEIKINGDWLVSGKSRLQLLFGWTSRDSADAVSRNFSGPTARATWNWAASGKTSLIASLWKEVTAVDDVLAAYSVNKGVSLSPSWSLSQKVTMRGDLRYEKRDFQGSAIATFSIDRTASLTMAYAPFRNTLLQASRFMFSRQGNAYGGGYKRHGAMLTAQYTF